jgi:excisionase family DNA binding protein
MLRKALVRAGVDPIRAKNATVYWGRKGQESYLRGKSKGLGDKYTAEQAGHSENMMRKYYDGPEIVERADFIEENLWSQLGLIDVGAHSGRSNKNHMNPSSNIPEDDLKVFSASMYDELNRESPKSDMTAGEFDHKMWIAARKSNLLYTFNEAEKLLDIDGRTLERWEESGSIHIIRLDGRRFILKSKVHEILNALSPEQAAKFLGITDRHVRNLTHEGKITGVIRSGKKILIPWTALANFMPSKNCLP